MTDFDAMAYDAMQRIKHSIATRAGKARARIRRNFAIARVELNALVMNSDKSPVPPGVDADLEEWRQWQLEHGHAQG